MKLAVSGKNVILRCFWSCDPSFPELKVEASSNIFLEDLQNTRSLETTYYVTDMTQAYDFYWDRESELRVNIGILDIHLIPEYHDVGHDGDNEYMLSNPNESEDRSKYQHIIQNTCRYLCSIYVHLPTDISELNTSAVWLWYGSVGDFVMLWTVSGHCSLGCCAHFPKALSFVWRLVTLLCS